MIEKLRPKNLLLGTFRYIPIENDEENNRSYESKIYVIFVESIDISNKEAYCRVVTLSRKREEEEIDGVWSKTLNETFKKEVKIDTYNVGGVIECFDSLLLVEENGFEKFCEIRNKSAKLGWQYLEQEYPIGMSETVPK